MKRTEHCLFLPAQQDNIDAMAPFRLVGAAKRNSIGLMGLLAVSVLLTANGHAQVINDPAASMIFQGSSRFQAVREVREAEEKQEAPTKESSNHKAEKIADNEQADQPDSKRPAEPELDLKSDVEDGQDGASTDGEPIKARAVMVDINSNNLTYDKDHDVYVATGSVHMVISEQNSELFCDKLTYDQNQDLAIAEGSVVIVKDGQRTEGRYAKIDLTRRSALIHDPVTTISAVRVKAQQSLVNKNELIMENGRFIISGVIYQELAKQGGLSALGQSTGKGSQQAMLRREYVKKAMRDRSMTSQLSIEQRLALENAQMNSASEADKYDDSPDKLSRFHIRAKEIEVVRHEDGYDDITLKRPSLYAGKYKLFTFPNVDFSNDEETKNIQYLGPDVGSYRAYGGAYAGPGWDFHVGKGSLRLSPVASWGSPGFWSSNGKDGKQISNGFGVGAMAHYRDADTTLDLAYNSRVGSPVGFLDRRLWGNSTHFMAAYNDGYANGLLGQTERPNYIAQITDYRILKEFSKFQLSSFESIGYARDNFYPNFRQAYFIEADKNKSPQMLGRAQLQFQLQNTAPLLRMGKYASMGMQAQLLTAAYSSADFIALGRIGPTMNLNLFDNKLQTNIGYTLSHTLGKSPFVFDSYYGGAQNLTVNNVLRINKYLSIGNNGSFSLNRDNAKKALAVGNMLYMLVGPTDLKATIGYDFVNMRSYFGFNYFPGNNNTVVDFDKMRVIQPASYTKPGAKSVF